MRGEGRLCPTCRAVDVYRIPMEVQGLPGAWVLGRFEGPMGKLAQGVKDRADHALALEVAALFARRNATLAAQVGFDAIVPAPSTPWSRFSRGFALAAVLAEALGRASGIPVVHALSRGQGRRQQGLDRLARQRNLVGRIRAEVAPPGFVLLVDDVVTTGATADACVRELLGGGSRRVWLAALAVAR